MRNIEVKYRGEIYTGEIRGEIQRHDIEARWPFLADRACLSEGVLLGVDLIPKHVQGSRTRPCPGVHTAHPMVPEPCNQHTVTIAINTLLLLQSIHCYCPHSPPDGT